MSGAVRVGVDESGTPYVMAKWAVMGVWKYSAELRGARTLAGCLFQAVRMMRRGARRIRIYKSGKKGRIIQT